MSYPQGQSPLPWIVWLLSILAGIILGVVIVVKLSGPSLDMRTGPMIYGQGGVPSAPPEGE